MNKALYVSDTECIIALPGIRTVTKSDTTYSDRTNFYLEVEYRGSKKQVHYKDGETRDDMYNKIRLALTPSETKDS